MESLNDARIRQLRRWFFVSDWRNLYLGLAAVHFLIWRVGGIMAPDWDRYRIMGGLLPVEVLALRMMLELSIHPAWMFLAAFALSFRFQQVNTAPVVALACLLCFLASALTLLLALVALTVR